MTVNVTVRHDRQIICPLRFNRAVTGAPVLDAPEVDDRGFVMGPRPPTWGQSTTRGAMVGITEGDTVRVKVLREDIDATAPLFATSTDTQVVRVIAPAGGGPIPADGVFSILGVKDFANRPVAVQVRLGAVDGPILGEIEPHIFQLRRLRVRVHLVSINGVATTRVAGDFPAIFDTVNAIWRPCGLEFEVFDIVNTQVNGFAVAGQVTTNLSPPAGTPATWNEFSRLINTNVSATRINIYCVPRANQARGLTFDKDIRRPAPGVVPTFEGFGIMLVDAADGNDFAHELGHFLDLDDHVDDLGGNNFRFDIWARRCLMFRFNPYGDVTVVTPNHPVAEPAFRNDVGYGTSLRGALVTVKDRVGDTRDGELARARRRSLSPV